MSSSPSISAAPITSISGVQAENIRDQPRALVLALDELLDLPADELVARIVGELATAPLLSVHSLTASGIARRFSIGVCSGQAHSGPTIWTPRRRGCAKTSALTSSTPFEKSVWGLLTLPTSRIRPSTAAIDSAGVVLGVVVERRHAGVRDVRHAVDGAAADVQDDRAVDALRELAGASPRGSGGGYRQGTLPFPDGTIIARLAWKDVPSEENNKVFGRAQSFVPGAAPDWYLQFMVKDSKKYAATRGWGYAQFDKTAFQQTRRSSEHALPPRACYRKRLRLYPLRTLIPVIR